MEIIIHLKDNLLMYTYVFQYLQIYQICLCFEAFIILYLKSKVKSQVNQSVVL